MLLPILALAIQSLSPPAAQDHPELRARWERDRQSNEAFARRFLVEAGFRPLEQMVEFGLDVRQVRFVDPWFRIPLPGVEIEPGSNGSATLSIIGKSGPISSASISPTDWAALAHLEEAAFRPPSFDPAVYLSPAPNPAPPVYHAWGAILGSTSEGRVRTAGWLGLPTNPNEVAYAEAIARLAVRSRSGCVLNADPMQSFGKCFRPPLSPQVPRPQRREP